MKRHEMRTCGTCDHLVSVPVKRANHALHIILSLLTFGFWLPIWFFAVTEAAMTPAGKCPRCKGKLK